jgi:hypothetical protein
MRMFVCWSVFVGREDFRKSPSLTLCVVPQVRTAIADFQNLMQLPRIFYFLNKFLGAPNAKQCCSFCTRSNVQPRCTWKL